jgi:hypothetical protein
MEKVIRREVGLPATRKTAEDEGRQEGFGAFGTLDLSFHLRSPAEGLSIPAMQKHPPQLGKSRICGQSRMALS